MKKIWTLAFALVACALTSMAQDVDVNFPATEYSQDPKANYRLFKTRNVYTFIKLDTRTGQMELVQWSVNRNNRITYTLSNEKLIHPLDIEEPGRFTLYATTNMYNFVLLDQIDGRSWQVHWGTNVKQRWIQQTTYIDDSIIEEQVSEPLIQPKLAETTMLYSLDITPVEEDYKLQVTMEMAEVQKLYREHMLMKSPINQAYLTVVRKLMLSTYHEDWAYVDQLSDYMVSLLEDEGSVDKTELEKALENQTDFMEITKIFKRFQ